MPFPPAPRRSARRLDEAGGRGRLPLHTDSLATPHWSLPGDYALPARPRHGTVLKLARVRAAYPNPS